MENMRQPAGLSHVLPPRPAGTQRPTRAFHKQAGGYSNIATLQVPVQIDEMMAVATKTMRAGSYTT